MIVERSMNDDFLSNTYVVADEPGGHAVMIDAGGPVAPLLDYLRRGQLTLTHVLLTHHHHDHVSEVGQVLERYPGTPVLIHELERGQVPSATGTMAPGETIESGTLEIEPIHTPGHTAGMLSLLVGGTDVFTGDTLFKGSVGGVHAPGSTGFADIKTSIMDKLLAVGVLTSLDDSDLASDGDASGATELVEPRARNAMASGYGRDRRPAARGRESADDRGAEMMRESARAFGGCGIGRSERIATPAEAVAAGATYIVVGRQVTRRAILAGDAQDSGEVAGRRWGDALVLVRACCWNSANRIHRDYLRV